MAYCQMGTIPWGEKGGGGGAENAECGRIYTESVFPFLTE